MCSEHGIFIHLDFVVVNCDGLYDLWLLFLPVLRFMSLFSFCDRFVFYFVVSLSLVLYYAIHHP